MNIGDAAQASGLKPKTLRYYEDIELVVPARSDNGYRDYSQNNIHQLRFLQRARGLGFPVKDCRALLDLYEDRSRSSADVKAIGRARIDEIDAKLKELGEMRRALATLVNACDGDDRPHCPILEGLSG